MALKIKGGSWRNTIKNIYVFGILAIFFIVFAILSPKFVSLPSLAYIIQNVAPLLVVSVAATSLMISGNIDLSVGSILGCSAAVMATMSKNGVPLLGTVLLAVVCGIVIGFINGFLVSGLRITPVIATLVTMNIFLGIAKLICGAGIPFVKGVQPDFSFIGRGKIAGWPVQIFFIVGAIAIFVILQKKSIFGKYSIAIGGNKDAARLAGVHVDRIVWILYIIVGAAAALGGCLRASNMGIADVTSGQGFELDVIIAILIGGTSFAGGEGSVIRTIIGAFIVSVLAIGLNMINVPSFYQYVVKGGVLIAAVYLDKIVKERISA